MFLPLVDSPEGVMYNKYEFKRSPLLFTKVQCVAHPHKISLHTDHSSIVCCKLALLMGQVPSRERCLGFIHVTQWFIPAMSVSQY